MNVPSTPPSIWTEVSLRVRPEACEGVAALLQEVTGAGVTIEPAIEALGPDEGYLLDDAAPSTLRAYFYGPVPAGGRASLRRRLLAAGLGHAIAGRLVWRTIREEDWAEAWKTHYDIERVGRIVIRPAWRDYKPQPEDLVVSLDPGMAFGTGQHPTTRMCLEAMQRLIDPGDHVLDLGSGSGILAIAAVALGATRVVAADTEEQAVASTLANAELNGVAQSIEVLHGSIDAAGDRGPFDCVLANINAATIARLAPELHASLKPDAPMLAGGIIEEREEACAAALEAAGCRIERRLRDGDWRTFLVYRAQTP